MIRIVSAAAWIAGLLVALAAPAAAEERADQRYPTRQVRIIVPFPAGGPIDVMARLIGQKLSPSLGQVIIENRPGGGSTVGLKAAVTAEPDGHTLMVGGLMTLSVLPTMSKGTRYRSGERICADRRGVRHAVRADRSAAGLGAHRAGADRLRQGQSRQDQFRRTGGRDADHGRRAVQDAHRHQHRHRSLSRRRQRDDRHAVAARSICRSSRRRSR